MNIEKPCCKNKFQNSNEKTNVEGIEKMNSKATSFKLRNDLMVDGISTENGDFISVDYADEKVCIEFLKFNPNRISLFEIYPENWMELIKNNTNSKGDAIEQNV